MIEIRPEELLTLCVRPRLGRMIDEDKRQSDQTDGRRIHLTEEEICLKNRDQLCPSLKLLDVIERKGVEALV